MSELQSKAINLAALAAAGLGLIGLGNAMAGSPAGNELDTHCPPAPAWNVPGNPLQLSTDAEAFEGQPAPIGVPPPVAVEEPAPGVASGLGGPPIEDPYAG